MKYVMRALVTGKHSFGRKVLHFVTVVAAAMPSFVFIFSRQAGMAYAFCTSCFQTSEDI